MNYSELLKRPEWKKFAEKVKKKVDWTCQKCGAVDKPLHAHHLKYVKGRLPWQYHLSLMQCLCETCHHAEYEEEKERKEEEKQEKEANEWFSTPRVCQRCGAWIPDSDGGIYDEDGLEIYSEIHHNGDMGLTSEAKEFYENLPEDIDDFKIEMIAYKKF